MCLGIVQLEPGYLPTRATQGVNFAFNFYYLLDNLNT